MKELVLRLFNLDKVDFRSAEGWSLRFTTDWAAPILLFGSIALVILVWQVYRREKGTATPAFKALLALLRLTALAALVFILLAPAVVVRKSELKEAHVLVLADKSDSMKLEDRYRDEKLLARLAYATGLTETLDVSKPLAPELADKVRAMSRAEIANRALANPRLNLADRIARHSKVRQFIFADTISPAPTAPPKPPEGSAPPREPAAGVVPPILIVPDGPITQIGESIRDAIAELRGQPIAAMVVISDWCSNSGLSPVEAARYALDPKSTFPIFAVGVGDPAEQRDIIVSSVSANVVAFLNDPLVFTVAIEQVGYDGQVVPLQLRVDDAIVAAVNITLEPGRKYYTISHRPEKKGVFKYVVTIPRRDDELSGANNSAEHTVTVKDDKIRVLLVSATPTWEWRYLKTALARDKTVEPSTWLQSADAEWVMAGGTQLSQFPLNRKEIVDAYDVIILLGASADAFSNDQLENIRSFVGDFGGGLIFSLSQYVPFEAFAKTPLDKCLPVSLEPPSGFAPQSELAHSFRPRITPEGWAHPTTKLLEDPAQNRELWDNLPELSWFQPLDKPKPAAHAIAVHPEDKTDRGPLVVFVEQRYGAGRVFFSATDDTWRWRFVIGDKYFYRFWRQTIGLLAANKLLGAAKRLTIAVAKNAYTVGQKVEIEAKILDDMLRPSDEKSVSATIDLPGGGSQEIKLSLADPTQGVYHGAFIPRKVGSYAVWMRPTPEDKPETAPFTVVMSTLESESRRLDLETMNAVAKKTSGVALFIDQVDQLPDRIKGESSLIITEPPTEIWDSWGCFLLFLIPLSLEWWFRKRKLLT